MEHKRHTTGTSSSNNSIVLSRRPMNQQKHVQVGVVSFRVILIVLSTLFCIGVFFSIIAIPASIPYEENGAIVKNVVSGGLAASTFFSGGGDSTLSDKVQHWMSSTNSIDIPNKALNSHSIEPDWSQEFWSPIEIDTSGNDPTITLCKLNFKTYTDSPNVYPMNKDLISLSKCFGSNVRYVKMSVILAEIDDAQRHGLPDGNVVEPTGFVFHESRVGSTLVANSLACDPFAMVYSESAPPSNVLLKCGRHCERDRETHVQLFRNVIRIMGRSPIHKRLFFKFQSITSTQMEIALEVVYVVTSSLL